MLPPLPASSRLGLSLRPMRDADTPFDAALYASTRSGELAATGWPVEQQRAFLEQQYRAQRQHYRTHYSDASWLVIESGAEAVGRLYLLESGSELRIIDISLAPAARGKGFGSALLGDVLAAAAAAGKTVTMHVERHNPARRLYERLGFTLVEDLGVYLRLEWRPAA